MPFSVPQQTAKSGAGSWEANVLPESQRAPALGQAAARLWKSNPANAMTLSSNIEAVDADGDGTIDAQEFVQLLKQGGAEVANVQKLFAQMDKDGDGELTLEEIAALQDVRRGKVKAQN